MIDAAEATATFRRVMMDRQDNLPPEWRELVYRHGQKIVFALLDGGATIDEAQDFLCRRKS